VITAIVAGETLLLVLLLVLVAGLLRSNAEILRRLGPPDEGRREAVRVAPGESESSPPVTGSTPAGDAVTVAFERAPAPTLLAFLTSGCGTCRTFWDTLGERRLPSGIQTLIVTHGAERESPAKLLSLAPSEVPVVMSEPAWGDYRVPGAPYFVLVDGTVRGEGVARTWDALSSLIGDALADEALARDGASRARRIDERFAAAGIGPDDPSLYPAGVPAGRPKRALGSP